MTPSPTVLAEKATEPPPDPPRGRRITVGRVGAFLVIAGIVGLWVYVLGVRWTGYRDIDELDVVDDAAWVADAEAACAPTAAALADVGPPPRSATPAERGLAIQATTDILLRRFTALEALPPTTSDDPDDAAVIAAWLDDWRLHLTQRAEFAQVLADSPDADVRPPPDEDDRIAFNGDATEEGESISERMNAFAQRNGIEECDTPHDLD